MPWRPGKNINNMKIDRTEITGIILAGGKSNRMGTDKAFLSLAGRPLIAHVIIALEAIADKIILVGGDKRLDTFGKKRIEDMIADAGPLAGLYTGLHHSDTEYNLVLGCDTPFVNKTLFETILNNTGTMYDVVQVASRKSTMPLIALYRKGCKDHIHKLITRGERRMQEAVATMKTKTLLLDASQEKFLININTREDLEHLRKFPNNK